MIKSRPVTAVCCQIISYGLQIKLKSHLVSVSGGLFVIFSADGCDVMEYNPSAPQGVDTNPVISTVLTFCSDISCSLLWSNNSLYLLKCPNPWTFTNNPALSLLYYFTVNAMLMCPLLPRWYLWNACW